MPGQARSVRHALAERTPNTPIMRRLMRHGLTALGVGVGQFCLAQDPREGFMEVVVFELGLKG